jgi:hypothetical protein
MNDREICELVNRAFSGTPRPEHFTDYTHCEECREHDDTMRARELHSLTIEDLGNPGWDPVCFLTPDAFQYWFPAFVRLVFQGDESDSYLHQLLFHLTCEGVTNRHFSLFTRSQRQAVLAFLRHVAEEKRTEWSFSCDFNAELAGAVFIWEKIAKRDAAEA